MKKLLSLFTLSSILLTSTSNTIACTSIDNPIYGIKYSYKPIAPGAWSGLITYDVRLETGNPGYLYLEDGNSIFLDFFNLNNSGDRILPINNIKLGKELTPLPTSEPNFRLTMNEYDFKIQNYGSDLKEITLVLVKPF